MAERKRKGIGKKTRFEVFKRDKFTCQYCGKSAPEVVLEIDHIEPVSKGGTNGIMNLITSCRDCNRGKSNKELSDDSVIKKQQEQLKELADRKEQLEMMLQWRKSLEDIESDYIDVVADEFQKKTGYSTNDKGKKAIKKWLKDFSLTEILDAMDISVESYFQNSGESAENTFNKISGICYNRKKQQNDLRPYYANYIIKVLKDKEYFCNDSRVRSFAMNNIRSDEDFERAKRCLFESQCWSEFINNIRNEFEVSV